MLGVVCGRSRWFVKYLIVDYKSALKKPLKKIAVKQVVPLRQRFDQWVKATSPVCYLPS